MIKDSILIGAVILKAPKLLGGYQHQQTYQPTKQFRLLALVMVKIEPYLNNAL